jgi:hypothetical protein
MIKRMCPNRIIYSNYDDYQQHVVASCKQRTGRFTLIIISLFFVLRCRDVLINCVPTQRPQGSAFSQASLKTSILCIVGCVKATWKVLVMSDNAEPWGAMRQSLKLIN